MTLKIFFHSVNLMKNILFKIIGLKLIIFLKQVEKKQSKARLFLQHQKVNLLTFCF